MATSSKPSNPFGAGKQSQPTLNELINRPSSLQQQQMSAGGGMLL